MAVRCTLFAGTHISVMLCEVNIAAWMSCSYEQERLPRVKTIHVNGVDSASIDDKEKYLFKPTFKPLWRHEV